MKIQIKGFVKSVGPVISKTAADRSKFHYEQSILILIPGYVDQFGDKKGEDEIWEFKIFNDAIDKHNLHATIEGRKAVVDGYLNSRAFKKNGVEAYALNLRLADIKLL